MGRTILILGSLLFSLLVGRVAFADAVNRKPMNALTMQDLTPKPTMQQQNADGEAIYPKMVAPPKVKSTANSDTKAQVFATCTDSRRITRTNADPFYKDCLEERPRVANPPLSVNDPGQTTFGISLVK